MKTKLSIGATVMASMLVYLSVQAQITNIKVDSTVTLNRVYAGLLAGGQFHTDTISNNAFVSTRFGAEATWQATKWFAVQTYGMYHLEGANSFHLQSFNLKFTPIKKVRIQTGYMATLATEQRPHPVSGDGHFETFTEAQAPGSAYNTKVVVETNKKTSFGFCMAYRNGLEYQAMFGYRWMKISGWYDANQQFGSILTLDFPRVYNVSSWRQDQVIANFLCIKMGKNKDYCLYSDNGYNLEENKLVRSESGFLKTFNSKWINGLFGIGYRYETKSINGYLFVHL